MFRLSEMESVKTETQLIHLASDLKVKDKLCRVNKATSEIGHNSFTSS